MRDGPSREPAPLALEVQNLTAGYGGIEVLRGIDLEASPGEVIAVLGVNGAGKSTLLNVIAGLHPASSGSVRAFGTDVTGDRADALVKAGLVLVPEGRELFPPLTVLENLQAALIRLRVRSKEETASRIEQVYEFFPVLADRRSHLAGTLSGGEQQMLAIARALMVQPQIMLLDEPSLGLNPLVIDQIYERLHEMAASGGPTIVLVEQHVERALGLASRGYVLDLGEVAASGSASELRGPAVRAVYMGSEDQ